MGTSVFGEDPLYGGSAGLDDETISIRSVAEKNTPASSESLLKGPGSERDAAEQEIVNFGNLGLTVTSTHSSRVSA